MNMVSTFGHKSLDFASLKELGLVGMPLMISGTFFSLLLASDRSIVAAFMTKEDVGMCSLASLIINSLQVIPQSISMIIFPKMAQHYGRHRSRHGLRRFLLQSLALNAATVVPASLICYFSIPHLVEHLFPAYRDGIPAAKVASLTCLLWIYLGVGSIIGVTNRMRPYLAAMGLAILIVWIFGYYAVRNGYGVVGVAWARFAGTAILCVFTICYSWYLSTHTGADSERDA
jgi:O-antigen/teichoic acid export membrane protein